MKNHRTVHPFIPTDGLELYYDVKGKKNTDNYKGTLLDMSGKGRHGTLSNFAYEGVSGFAGTTEGGLLLDDVDDKIVRPAITGIEYTSASRNLFNEEKLTLPTKVINNQNYWIVKGVNDGTSTSITIRSIFKQNTQYTVQYLGVVTTYFNVLVFSYTDGTKTTRQFTDGVLHNYTSLSGKTIDYITIDTGSTSAEGYIKKNTFQLEEGTTATPYTPYIPLPIMTYQMNGNILSFEKDGTVKRTTKDANGNEVVVSRKGINLIRNGNFANGLTYWKGQWSNPRTEEGEIIFTTTAKWGGAESTQNIGNTQGDIFYASIDMKTSSPGCCFYMMNDIANKPSNIHSGSGEYERLHVRYEYNFSNGTKNYLAPKSTHSTTFGEIRVKNAQGINLTQAYGAGNEPTLEYIQSHPEEFAWTPNPNDLIETVEIKNNLVGDLENLQGNDFEQHEDGVITYTNEAEEGSVVRVDIDGISDQPLRFRNATGEQVVITEHDQTDEDAIKKVEFQGNSVQLADKYREVSGTTVVIAPELHDKNVADKLVIGGNTTQYTESSNVVTDGLQMWLSGRNFSNNPATTTWKDLTGVNNGTVSGFEYRTNVYADVVSDFASKIAGSVVENANIFRRIGATTLKDPNTGQGEQVQAQYDSIKTLDGSSWGYPTSANGYIPQQLFSFNVIKAFEKQHGNIPSTDKTTAGKVAWLKDNSIDLAISWYGYGTCPSGNMARTKYWNSGVGWSGAEQKKHTNSTSTEIIQGITAYNIQSDGFVHLLSYTDASDGVTASIIYTDYVRMTMKFSGASGSDEVDGVNFDGVDDFLSIPLQQYMNPTGIFTVEALVSGINTSKINCIFQNSLGINSRIGLTTSSETAIFGFYDGITWYGKSGSLVKGQLNHIVGINKFGVIKLFINGIEQTGTGVPYVATYGSFIGKESISDSRNDYLNGKLHYFRAYNRALSDAEVLQNYNAGLSIPIPNIAMPQEVKHVTSGSKVLVHGKNLFNPLDSNIRNASFSSNRTFINSPLSADRVVSKATNSIVYNCTRNFDGVGVYKKLKSNTTYTFSATQSGGSSNMWVSYATYNDEADINSGTKAVKFGVYTNVAYLTTGVSDVHVVFALTAFAIKETITATNIQLEEGSTATAYEPFKGYQETTIPVTLKSIG